MVAGPISNGFLALQQTFSRNFDGERRGSNQKPFQPNQFIGIGNECFKELGIGQAAFPVAIETQFVERGEECGIEAEGIIARRIWKHNGQAVVTVFGKLGEVVVNQESRFRRETEQKVRAYADPVDRELGAT